MKKKNAGCVMVIAAHPDDEVFGCGATVHKLVRRGWRAHLVVMSAGVGGRHTLGPDSTSTLREEKNAWPASMVERARVYPYA